VYTTPSLRFIYWFFLALLRHENKNLLNCTCGKAQKIAVCCCLLVAVRIDSIHSFAAAAAAAAGPGCGGGRSY
jgi:hypothetical protein